MLLLGGGLGMLAATSLLPVLNGAIGGRFPALCVNGSAWLVALGIAVVLALAPGLHPALHAWRLKIVEALAGALINRRDTHAFVQPGRGTHRHHPPHPPAASWHVAGGRYWYAGVVGVLVAVLAMSEGFRHTLASTGRHDRVIMLRAGSDAELSSGLERDQVTLVVPLPGVARDAGGQPLVSAELMVMVDLPRQGQTDPNNVPFRGVQPTAFTIRDELKMASGRRFERGVLPSPTADGP